MEGAGEKSLDPHPIPQLLWLRAGQGWGQGAPQAFLDLDFTFGVWGLWRNFVPHGCLLEKCFPGQGQTDDTGRIARLCGGRDLYPCSPSIFPPGQHSGLAVWALEIGR